MVTRRIGTLLMLCQTADAPSEEEWDECLRLLKETDDINTTRVLVVTEGGGPTLSQRRRLDSLIRGTNVCSAVVSDSIKVRFIVSSVALFIPKISTFQMSELPKACHFLGLSRAQEIPARKALAEMRKLLGLGAQPTGRAESGP